MNRRRPSLLALPAGVKLGDFDFAPTKGEREAESRRKNRLARLDWLEEQRRKWNAAELQFLRDRVAVLESVIRADREFVAKENEKERRRMVAESETRRIESYYATEEQKELLTRLTRATQAINADIIRTERKELERRGVIRGRRRP